MAEWATKQSPAHRFIWKRDCFALASTSLKGRCLRSCLALSALPSTLSLPSILRSSLDTESRDEVRDRRAERSGARSETSGSKEGKKRRIIPFLMPNQIIKSFVRSPSRQRTKPGSLEVKKGNDIFIYNKIHAVLLRRNSNRPSSLTYCLSMRYLREKKKTIIQRAPWPQYLASKNSRHFLLIV